jgi:hypothetical protein
VVRDGSHERWIPHFSQVAFITYRKDKTMVASSESEGPTIERLGEEVEKNKKRILENLKKDPLTLIASIGYAKALWFINRDVYDIFMIGIALMNYEYEKFLRDSRKEKEGGE